MQKQRPQFKYKLSVICSGFHMKHRSTKHFWNI